MSDTVRLNLPSGRTRIEIGSIDASGYFIADADGAVDVPRWAVPELLEAGCVRVDEVVETIEVGDELDVAPQGELVSFLMSRGEVGILQQSPTYDTEEESRVKAVDVLEAELLQAVAPGLITDADAFYTPVVAGV